MTNIIVHLYVLEGQSNKLSSVTRDKILRKLHFVQYSISEVNRLTLHSLHAISRVKIRSEINWWSCFLQQVWGLLVRVGKDNLPHELPIWAHKLILISVSSYQMIEDSYTIKIHILRRTRGLNWATLYEGARKQ